MPCDDLWLCIVCTKIACPAQSKNSWRCISRAGQHRCGNPLHILQLPFAAILEPEACACRVGQLVCPPERAWCLRTAPLWHGGSFSTWARTTCPTERGAGIRYVWLGLQNVIMDKRLANEEIKPTDSIFVAAFTSVRTNLSPFTKGCREWDASM